MWRKRWLKRRPAHRLPGCGTLVCQFSFEIFFSILPVHSGVCFSLPLFLFSPSSLKRDAICIHQAQGDFPPAQVWFFFKLHEPVFHRVQVTQLITTILQSSNSIYQVWPQRQCGVINIGPRVSTLSQCHVLYPGRRFSVNIGYVNVDAAQMDVDLAAPAHTSLFFCTTVMVTINRQIFSSAFAQEENYLHCVSRFFPPHN